MSLSVWESKMSDTAAYLPAALQPKAESYRQIYEQNRHRIYAWAFWMTDHELAAEELMTHTFCSAFARIEDPSADDIDRAFISVLREHVSLGSLTLNCKPCDRMLSVRRNTLRIELERAVIQLPNTEKLIFLMHDVERYDHPRISRLLGISDSESRLGLHQARLRLRELLAK